MKKPNGIKGTVKHCCFGGCNSDTRYYEDSVYTFQSFPKPCYNVKQFVTAPSPGHISRCEFCKKSIMWIEKCNRSDGKYRGNFSKIEHVTKDTYICSRHFVKQELLELYPYPLPAEDVTRINNSPLEVSASRYPTIILKLDPHQDNSFVLPVMRSDSYNAPPPETHHEEKLALLAHNYAKKRPESQLLSSTNSSGPPQKQLKASDTLAPLTFTNTLGCIKHENDLNIISSNKVNIKEELDCSDSETTFKWHDSGMDDGNDIEIYKKEITVLKEKLKLVRMENKKLKEKVKNCERCHGTELSRKYVRSLQGDDEEC